MNISRRDFLRGMAAGAALAAMPGYCKQACNAMRPGKVALQLYSLNKWIPAQDQNKTLALAKALKKVGEIGFEGVEFAGYYNAKPAEIKAMLADAGLVACGTHVGNNQYGFDTKKFTYNPEVLKKTAEFELGYGNTLVICPGGGNIPPGCSWSTGRGGESCKPSQAIDDFTKRLVDLYNKAAADATKLGIKIGLHNHTWEHAIVMQDGTSFWDYFFTNTDKAVCMEQDVGWTTCAGDMIPGVNPMVQYKKYPHRSPTLHAKENGMGKGVKKFDAILGQPGCDENGKVCATPVAWDELFPVTDADGVEWYVVECERHFDDINGAVIPSFNFLKSKGRV
ncbi:MAG: sugar phosphate isomerase/epimerase [Kiritimatiellae bacterium]|nr:sugar phosphate isomerase/epimerase [Kiritimatiellia bacterium]